MLENTEKITGIKGMGKNYDRIYLNAEEFGACIYTSRYALYDGYKTGSENGEPVAPLMGNIKDYDGGTGDFQMGPLSFMLNYPDHCILYRFIPRSITSTDMELVWFVNEDAYEQLLLFPDCRRLKVLVNFLAALKNRMPQSCSL